MAETIFRVSLHRIDRIDAQARRWSARTVHSCALEWLMRTVRGLIQIDEAGCPCCMPHPVHVDKGSGATRVTARKGSPVMSVNSRPSCSVPGHKLHFCSLDREGFEYSFPCDKEGRVDMDSLSYSELRDYLFVRATVGKAFSTPIVSEAP